MTFLIIIALLLILGQALTGRGRYVGLGLGFFILFFILFIGAFKYIVIIGLIIWLLYRLLNYFNARSQASDPEDDILEGEFTEVDQDHHDDQ